jgi:hypothetical protein
MRKCGDSGSIAPRIITSSPCRGVKSVSRARLFALREVTPVHFGLVDERFSVGKRRISAENKTN